MTAASNYKPTKRVVASKFGGPMVVEVGADFVVLRPKGCRKGGPAEVSVTWGSIYDRAIWDIVRDRKKAKRRSRKGGRR